MDELIICAQLNEGMTRDSNPHVPFGPDEIAEDAARACAAGAALTHVHGRTSAGGMDDSLERHRALAIAVRARTGILLAPPLLPATDPVDPTRFAVLSDTVARPDFAVIELGSTNFDLVGSHGDYTSDTRLFHTPTAAQVNALRIADEEGLPVMAVSFNGSWSRALEVHLRAHRIRTPFLLLLVHGGDEFPVAHPATGTGFRAHRALVPEVEQVEWMVSAHRGDVLEIAEDAIRDGGHVAVGVGDYAHISRGRPSTAELVAAVADIGRRYGRPPATPDQVRAHFARRARTSPRPPRAGASR